MQPLSRVFTYLLVVGGGTPESLPEPPLVEDACPQCVPKSLVIALDGTRPDAFWHAETPHVDSLLKGDWAPGYQTRFTPMAMTVPDGNTYSGPTRSIPRGGR